MSFDKMCSANLKNQCLLENNTSVKNIEPSTTEKEIEDILNLMK